MNPDTSNPRSPSRALAAPTRLLAAKSTAPLLALFLLVQAAAAPGQGPLARLVSGAAFSTSGPICFIPAILRVLRMPDGSVRLDLGEQGSTVIIARCHLPPRPVSPAGLWAETATRYDHTLRFSEGAENLNPAEFASVRTQFADLWAAKPGLSQWAAYLRQGEGTTLVPVPSGYIFNALALFTAAALALACTFRARDYLRRWRQWNAEQRLAAGQCPACGYAIANLPEPRCPECGATWSPAEPRRNPDDATSAGAAS